MNRHSLHLHRRFVWFEATLLALVLAITGAVSRLRADTGTCNGQSFTLPFGDVAGNPFFCFIAEVYFLGITSGCGNGTAYCPDAGVTRAQMAAFLDRTHDSALRRGSRRAALNQWATPNVVTKGTIVGANPASVQSDGADLWVANSSDGSVTRIRASDGRELGLWTGAELPFAVLVDRGYIYVTGASQPGKLYRIDPALPSADTTIPLLADNLGAAPAGITTDGTFIWTANVGGSVSKVDPETGAVTNITTGFNKPRGILYDGASLWVADNAAGTLLKLDVNGNVTQTVSVGVNPNFPVFDGTNLWVPNHGSNSVTVVRAATGAVLATLAGNGLEGPLAAAFDGQRVLVTNFFNGGGTSVSLWRAADLAPLGAYSTASFAGGAPVGACSDGINFWITLAYGPGISGRLARF